MPDVARWAILATGMVSDGAGADGADDEVAKLRGELTLERERLRALEEVGVALGSTLDLRELLSLVLDRVSKAIDADRSTLYLVDDDGEELWSEVAQGEELHRIRVRIGEGIAGWVASHGEVLNVPDAYQDVRFDAEWDRRTGYRTRSILAVPLRNHHGRIVGVIQSLNKTQGSFTGADAALLSALAAQAAVSIENSKLFLSTIEKNAELLQTKDQLERKVRELDVLFEIAQVSASAQRLDELLDGVLARAMRAIDVDASEILVEDDQGGTLRFRTVHDPPRSAGRTVRIRHGEGIVGWVARNGRPEVVADVDFDDRHSRTIDEATGFQPRSVLCVPLSWEGGSGALALLDKGGGREAFHGDDVKLATMIAGHVSTAIGLASDRERKARRERLSTIGQFLSGILHDLRTPMTVISGYLRLLVDEESREERRKLVDGALRQVDFIGAMTRETLAFARGEQKLLVRKVYLKPFFDDVVAQVRRALAERGVEVTLDVRERGVAWFDPAKIERAVHNLARNAAEAIGEAGGRFHVVVERGEGDDLLLQFEDDGPGIPEEILGRIFESFTSHGKRGGTGLGLAVVQRIVADHGGRVDVGSRPGHTRFSLRLPDAMRERAVDGGQPRGEDRPSWTPGVSAE